MTIRFSGSVRAAGAVLLLGAALAFGGGQVPDAGAQGEAGYRIATKAASFEDVSDNVRDAIQKRGYVVDYTGELNAMLLRTAADTGTITSAGKASPFKNARFLQFCPAKLTHEAVNASPFAIANCPITIFIFERDHEPGKIQVGYRTPVPSDSRLGKEVNTRLLAMLEAIVTDATK